ncbi:MAG: carboxypeptidase-like regulatory domain-containing protein [Bacteroidetes bacterium]|nr:carboxypeptidase-like regulatory domain-containing protein [Bacteroidota bacterium]MCW5896516.1 carboxypeptidase-like regulatory domain-containing protein [Bacteroidota bacterium]
MMKNISATIFLLVLLLATTGILHAQTGVLAGKIFDQQTGEELVGANVLIVGTTTGATTDIDGKYSVRNIPVGTYSVRISFVGYGSKTVTDVAIKAGQTATLNVSLTSSTVEADEIVITAERVRATESALLSERKKAAAIGDGISAEQIKRAPDATSGDALKRVTGISVVDNKFVYVRGITDRYNGTTVDGASVTSTEVGKKGFSFDLIPSNLIENTTVVKSATPDLPGDFTGGLVQVNTLDIPTDRLIKAGVSSSYNTVSTSKEFLVSQGGRRDWLGYDDGSRSMPAQDGSLTEFAKSLPNNWAPSQRKAPYNGSFSLTFGDQLVLGNEETSESRLGLITSLSYSNSFQRTNFKVNELTSGGFPLRRFDGAKDEYSVLWGAIVNATYKISNLHKISLKNSYNRSGEDQVSQYQGEDGNTGSEVRSTAIRWTQRSAYTGQIVGDHNFPELGGLMLQWRGTASSSLREDPDRKLVPYVRQIGSAPEDPFYVATSDRSWEKANDRSKGLGLDFSLPVGSLKTKGGLYYEGRTTDYKIRAYRITGVAGTPFQLYSLPIDSVFRPENLGAGGFAFFENPSNAASFYDGDQELIAGYAMMDAPFTIAGQDFRFVGGARLENSLQTLRSTRSLTDPTPETTQLKKIDALPSMNLTYIINPITNFRIAYSQSLNRPEFRELAPVAYYDFDRLETVFGNPTLQRALIKNYDARFELFPAPGEVVAVSYFHKDLSSPIEEMIDVSSTPIRTYINSNRAKNRGWEIEFRKSLDFLGGYFSNFMLYGNYTRITSEVEVLDEVTPGVFQISKRPLQGQSPYMVNLGFFFTEPTTRTSVSIFYNKAGRRIDAVGSAISEPDIYEEPRDLVDITVSQPLFNMFEVKFAVKNLNGREQFLSKRDQIYRSNDTGTTYSFSLSATL